MGVYTHLYSVLRFVYIPFGYKSELRNRCAVGFVWICYRSIEKRTLHCSENANVWLEIKFMCCWFFSLSFYSFLIVRHERRMGARVNEWVNRIEWVSNGMLLLLLLLRCFCCCCWRWWCFSFNGCFQLENCFILLHVCNAYTHFEQSECELCAALLTGSTHTRIENFQEEKHLGLCLHPLWKNHSTHSAGKL